MSIEDQIDSAKKIIGSEITNVNSNSLLIKSGGCASCHILFKLIESLSLNESDATDLLSEVLYQDAQLNERITVFIHNKVSLTDVYLKLNYNLANKSAFDF